METLLRNGIMVKSNLSQGVINFVFFYQIIFYQLSNAVFLLLTLKFYFSLLILRNNHKDL